MLDSNNAMFLFFRVYVGQWLTQVIFYFVLDSEYRLISFKTWICLLNICFLFCDGVCSTPANVLIMFLFNSFYLGNINKILIYIFKRALRDVTAKEGYHALESFCQNVRVVFWCLYIYIYAIMKTMCPPGYHSQWLCGNSCTWAHDVRLKHETVHHVPKCMSSHKATVAITGRAHCCHDCIYITLILLLWHLSTLRVVDHLWPLMTNI